MIILSWKSLGKVPENDISLAVGTMIRPSAISVLDVTGNEIKQLKRTQSNERHTVTWELSSYVTVWMNVTKETELVAVVVIVAVDIVVVVVVVAVAAPTKE